MTEKVIARELAEGDVSFLLGLWNTPEVMRFANEFPRLRGWSRSDSPQVGWQVHQEKHAELGHRQLVLCLADGTCIGESFFIPLREGFTFGEWVNPAGDTTFMGDIKLHPDFWGRGLGIAGMKAVVRWLFEHTEAKLLVVPPHKDNPAGQRTYQKVGFLMEKGLKPFYGHQVMMLSREQFGMD